MLVDYEWHCLDMWVMPRLFLCFSNIWWKFAINIALSSSESSSNHFWSDSSSVILVASAMKIVGIANLANTTTSHPYTSWKDVYLCSHFKVAWYAHRFVGTLSSQSSWFAEHTLVRPFSNILLKVSTVPLARGRYELLLWCCIMKF